MVVLKDYLLLMPLVGALTVGVCCGLTSSQRHWRSVWYGLQAAHVYGIDPPLSQSAVV